MLIGLDALISHDKLSSKHQAIHLKATQLFICQIYVHKNGKSGFLSYLWFFSSDNTNTFLNQKVKDRNLKGVIHPPLLGWNHPGLLSYGLGTGSSAGKDADWAALFSGCLGANPALAVSSLQRLPAVPTSGPFLCLQGQQVDSVPSGTAAPSSLWGHSDFSPCFHRRHQIQLPEAESSQLLPASFSTYLLGNWIMFWNWPVSNFLGAIFLFPFSFSSFFVSIRWLVYLSAHERVGVYPCVQVCVCTHE